MPIERKDRSFDLIFDQVSMDEVPADYIIEIKIVLIDGTEVRLDNEDLYGMNQNGSSALGSIDRESIVDISVKLDYEAIKADVQSGVGSYLGKFFEK
jgi:hypothetical protein